MGIFWFVLLFIINNHSQITLAADRLYSYCYPDSNTTSDSEYMSSRDSQLIGLDDNVKNYNGYYLGTTVNEATPVPYCLGLCRRDLITSDACYTCISTSASDVMMNCPVQKQAVAWGEDAACIVQCFPPGTQENPTQPLTYTCNTTTTSNNHFSQFVNTLANLTSKLAVQVANEGTSSFTSGYNTPQYFASQEAMFSDHLTVYAAGFCIPSLSKSECTACLKSAANQSAVNCHGKQGAKIFMAACVLRYELFPFYKSTKTISSAPPPSVSPPSGKEAKTEGRRKGLLITVLVILTFVTLLVSIIGISVIWKRRKQHWNHNEDDIVGDESIESCLEFSFNTIRVATNDFSESNKLGQGGFGVVYKGRLSNGLVVAVKRLTRETTHGEAEFRNEVQLVARLHHRNLVRLLGFCLDVKERILIYELAPNGSLDHLIFDSSRREILTWMIRYNIIQGIAHGLLYLHEESQLRIIHRDLKAGNILLDDSMIPKISDFGTARLFVEGQGSASKIVGTYGYMPPEYAKFGKISTKVDVFSFGVLFLEIISGRKNIAYSDNARRLDHLLSKAWKCWTIGQPQELIDPVLLRESEQIDDIVRCIHIGLLCVQEKAASRPIMSEVVLLLQGCSQILPPPSQPAYLMEIVSDKPSVSTTKKVYESTRINDSDGLSSLSSAGASSINEISFSNTYPGPR